MHSIEKVIASIAYTKIIMDDTGGNLDHEIYLRAGLAYMRTAEDADELVKEAAKNSIERLTSALQ